MRTRENPFDAFLNHHSSLICCECPSWQANRTWQNSSQTFEQTQTRDAVLHQVHKIGRISSVSASFWKDLFGSSSFSTEGVMEPYYELAEEFYKEILVLRQTVKAFLHTL